LEAEAGVKPRSPNGRAAARGLDPASASNTLSCQRETLHSQQLRSIKKSIDSDHGIYRKPKTADDARESVDSLIDGRSLQVDLVRLDRTVPVAGCVAS
jgi:FtsZ-interacting cell division protein YlmF